MSELIHMNIIVPSTVPMELSTPAPVKASISFDDTDETSEEQETTEETIDA